MRVCLIVNPNAGPSSFKKQLKKAQQELVKLGCQVERVDTTSKGDATCLAQQAAREGFEVAVAVGGDGTLNEVCNGLAGTETAMGVLPAGTANVYAADMKIPIWNPLNPEAVIKGAQIIATAPPRRIDLGRLRLSDGTRRYFLMWCGIGLDAAISQAKSSSHKSRSLSYASWFISGLMMTYEFMGIPATLTTDNGVVHERVLMAVVSNGQLYGRVWRVSPRAKMDDGLLDVGVLAGHGWPAMTKHIVGLTLGRHVQDPDFYLYRTKTLSFSARDPMPVHVDAETIGTTPIEVDIVPMALKVIVPENAPERLFEQDPYWRR